MLYAPSSPGNAKEPSREYYEAAGAVCKYSPPGTLYEKYYFWKEDKADYRFDGEPHWSRADSKKTQLAKAQALVRLHSPFRPAHLTRATDRRSSCAQNPAVKAPHGRWANVADCLPKSQRQPLAPASAGQVQALAETEAPRSPLMQRVMGTAQRVVAFRFSRSPSKSGESTPMRRARRPTRAARRLPATRRSRRARAQRCSTCSRQSTS